MKTCPVCDTGYPDQHNTCPSDGAVLMESHELAPGSMVRGKYRITRKLGQGGMGTVYLAEHLLLGGRVALKFLAAELSRNPQFIKRFRNEARAAFQLRHPNIVEVTDLDQAEDGSLFIAMEYVDGPSLREIINAMPGGLPVDKALAIARGIASGLSAAHARGTVHRDIKPENILLASEAGQAEQPKVLDFGIAAMMQGATAVNQTRGLMLTPEYASPEQWRGTPAAELDGRTDLYELGCVLYEMLTGHTPFQARSLEGWMYQHLQEMPRPPRLLRPELADWQGLDSLVLRLLAKSRDDRLQGAELLELLDNLLVGSSPEYLERPGTVIEEGWKRPGTIRTQIPRSATQLVPPPLSMPAASPAMPAASPAKPAQRKFPVWAWGALVLLALAAGLTAAHFFFAPQSQPQQAQLPAPQPVSSSNMKTPDAQQAQPSIADEPKSERVAAANPDLEKPRSIQLEKPTQPQPVRPLTPQSAEVQPPVQQPGSGEILNQAIALYAQKRYSEASALFDKACAGGSGEACKNLGNMYRLGNGVAQDYTRAASLYSKACDSGNARSCADLGFLYASGNGVVKDDARAAQLYATACNNGDGMGCSNLGNVFANGRGVSKDDSQAVSLYLKACAVGDGPGCSNLGNSYRYGRGVTMDMVKAKQFLDKGCRLGNQWGCDRLKELQ